MAGFDMIQFRQVTKKNARKILEQTLTSHKLFSGHTCHIFIDSEQISFAGPDSFLLILKGFCETIPIPM